MYSSNVELCIVKMQDHTYNFTGQQKITMLSVNATIVIFLYLKTEVFAK